MKRTRAMATLRRSWRLLRSFRFEQTAPAVFYGGLAEDTAALVDALCHDHSLSLHGARVLDVGGGPGYFASAFAQRGASYVGLEPDAGEMAAAGIEVAHAVRGDGTRLPFADNTFDITYSSNVAEHIPHPWDMGEEMLRVTKPGGLVILSYTVWLGPFGGHETGLWEHYVGGEFARDCYTRRHGHPPKNVFGTSLFALSAREGLDWARRVSARGAKLVAAFPRYHPWWAWWVTKVPVVREFLTSNLVLVLRAEP
ncbi:bifunctional 2-polyprenyl-6-hydroxyphenol methylase/3-demethylubiquinol 3-O-methyltransferase UbiG [Corynebacterium sp. HMSC05E07]|uniref:class I SAM-dependent methyltransferase n=1 Tax=Corynebacterium sp. HMSC05E07 TaxID=1581117 RepID=UPI0008A1986B|nr:class I SAM-dependent methyltransferase [Corynebacterium sp. HMSC05E07]OFT60395.1 SAM-dependent methyltransferase [Corynebacterium sp. HMSC05E07]